MINVKNTKEGGKKVNKSKEQKTVWLTTQRKVILSVIAVLLTIAIITGIYPYFTSIKNAENVFTIGNIDINLTEGDEWDAAVASGETPDLAQDIQPKQHIAKSPVVQNIGNNPAYVYLKVYIPVYKGDDLFTYIINETDAQNTGWTKRDEDMHTTIDGQVYNIYTYEYDEMLEPGTETTSLFDEVIFAEDKSFTPEEVIELGNVKNIIIKAYAIQTEAGVEQETNEITELMTSDSNEKEGTALYLQEGELVRYVPTGTYTWDNAYATSNSTGTIMLDATGNCAITDWRILSIEGETVNLVPANGATSQTVLFQGAQGYNNAVQLLNIACSELYKNATLGITARSINVDDFEKASGVAAYRDANTGNSRTYSNVWRPIIYADELSGAKTVSQPISKSNEDLIARNNSSKIGAVAATYTCIQNYYALPYDELSTRMGDLATKLLPNNSSTNYWVASRGVAVFGAIGCFFSVRSVNDGDLYGRMMFESYGTETGNESIGIFPVVSLNSEHLRKVTNLTYQYEVK